MARYAVGAVKQTVAACRSIRSASSSGVAFSTSRVAAPTRIGNTSRPPSPNVKASGGVPMKTSSGTGRTRCLENVSAIARTSRWKCIVALGRPVVPEVKASSATSSAEVSIAVNSSAAPVMRAARSSLPGPPYVTIGAPPSRAASRSSTNRTSHSARSTLAISATAVSSTGRSSGMVVTTTPPALRTANQHATSHGLLGPRTQHPVAGHDAEVAGQHRGDPVGGALQLAVAPALAGRREQAGAVRAEIGDHGGRVARWRS